MTDLRPIPEWFGFDQVYGLLPEGWLDREEAELLALAAFSTWGNVVEFGTHLGRSAVLLAACRVRSLASRIWCVDPWGEFKDSDILGEERYRRFLKLASSTRALLPVRQRVEDFKPVAAGLVYCDGDHSFSGTNSQLEKAKACKPELIAVHDVFLTEESKEVRRACDHVFGRGPDWRAGKLGVWRMA